MAKKVGLEIDVKSDSVGQATAKSKSLKSELKELKEQLQKMDDTSPEFLKLAKAAGEVEDKIKATNEQVRAFAAPANERALSGILDVTNGLVGGFTAVQGAMALWGNENEDLQKTFVKLQGAIALLNGLTAVQNTLKKESAAMTLILSKANQIAATTTATLSKAFGGLTKAIIATGIGALVVAVGLLIANFDKLAGAVNGVSREQKDLLADGEKRLVQSEKELSNISEQDNILKLQGKSQMDILKLKQAAIKDTIREAEILIDTQETIKQTQIQASKRNQAILKGVLDFLTVPLQLLIDYANKAAKLLGFEGFDFNIAEKVAGAIFNPERVGEEGDEVIAEARDRLNKLKNEEAGYQLAINDIRKKAEDERLTDEEKRRQKEEKDAQDRIANRHKEEEELQQSVDKEIAERRRLMEEKERLRKIDYENTSKAAKATIANIIEREKAMQEFQMSLLQSTASGFASISNLFEQGSAAQKVFALASIAADTASGLLSGLRIAQQSAAALGPGSAFAFPAFYATQVAAVLGAAANARQVLKGGGSVGSVGSVNTGATIGTRINAPNPTQVSGIGIRQKDTRVFVLESDISRTQRRVNVIQSNAVID